MAREIRIETGRLFEAADYLLRLMDLWTRTPAEQGLMATRHAAGAAPFTDDELIAAAEFLRRLGLPVQPNSRVTKR